MKPPTTSAFDRDLDALTHEHVFLGHAHDRNARRTLIVVVITTAMMAGEIAAGAAFNSMALLADGFHMATHAGALAVAAAAYAHARKHARTGRYTFGAGKVGDLAGFASALVLGVAAMGIAYESVMRLLDPRPVAFGEATVVAVLGLIVNLVCAGLLSGGGGHHRHGHGHGHANRHDHHHGHDHHDHGHGRDNNLRAAFVHVLADALTSVLAIAALMAGRYLGWAWLDAAMGIIGAAVIASWSWTLMRDTAGVLLDRSDAALEAEVRQAVEEPGGVRITDLHVWRIGPGAFAAIVAYAGDIPPAEVRRRLALVHELGRVTVEAL